MEEEDEEKVRGEDRLEGVGKRRRKIRGGVEGRRRKRGKGEERSVRKGSDDEKKGRGGERKLESGVYLLGDDALLRVHPALIEYTVLYLLY